jgi:hypothetical protein
MDEWNTFNVYIKGEKTRYISNIVFLLYQLVDFFLARNIDIYILVIEYYYDASYSTKLFFY